MRADSKAAEGALQSTIHLPKQFFLSFKVVREQREMFLSPFLRSVSILIPSPKSFPCSHAAFSDVISKHETSGLLWLCPVLIHGAVNICTRVCSSPRGWEIQILKLTSGLWFPLCLPPHSVLQYQCVWSGDLAPTTTTAQSLTLSQHSCSQRALLTMYSALIQHNQPHHLNFQSPTEHLINNK